MTKSFLFILLIYPFIFLHAQSTTQRLVLIEEATNTGCGPCAAQNPAFDALLQANMNKVAVIKYHPDWPSNNDPFYVANWSENDARVSYYAVTGVPSAFMDGIAITGSSYDAAPANLTQSMIDNEYASPATFDISVTATPVGNGDITVTAVFHALQDFNTNQLRGHIIVIEPETHYASAPGSNGEKDFYWSMRKMLTGKYGYAYGAFTAGQKDTLTVTFTPDAGWNTNNIQVVAFMQHKAGRVVYNAAKTPLVALTGLEENINQSAVGIYPNPAADYAWLKLPESVETATITVFDLSGKAVQKEKIKANTDVIRLNTSGLPQGMYHLVIEAGATWNAKLNIKR